MKKVQLCPCHSSLSYDLCCKKFHKGIKPQNALELMRSRYCAYALSLADYIIQTTHPSLYEPFSTWKKSILEFSHATSFDDLIILEKSLEIPLSTVTFKACLSQKGQDVSFTEKSTFIILDGIWLYYKGELIN